MNINDDLLIPPHDLDAETCTIASLMLAGDDAALVEKITSIVKSSSFYSADCGIIYGAIDRIRNSGRPIDAVIVSAELKRAGVFEDVGGTAYLAAILNKVPSAAHGPHYAEIVSELYRKREIIRVANRAISQASGLSRTDRAADIATSMLDDLTAVAHGDDAGEIVTIGDAVELLIDSLDTNARTFIPTELNELDDLIGGLPVGGFSLIGGRPGMAKSQICKQFAKNVAERGIPVGIVTVEETAGKVATNLLANEGRVENCRIAHRTASAPEITRMIAAMSRLRKLPIFIADRPVRLSEVAAATRTLVVKHHCQVVIVDYIQLIEPDLASSSTEREITRISNKLKAVFKKLGVAGVAAAQLNRGNEQGGIRRPALRDLRGSGSLEQDADVVMLLHREDYYRLGEDGYVGTDLLEIIVAKNKGGCLGEVPAWFSGRFQAVTDWNGGRGSQPGASAHPFEGGE